MNSLGRIEGNYAYFWYQNFAMPIINCNNIHIDKRIKKEKEKNLFIKQYDEKAKLVLPVWQISGQNFDIKK